MLEENEAAELLPGNHPNNSLAPIAIASTAAAVQQGMITCHMQL